MKMTVFKDLPLNDFEKFKNYLHQIKNEVEELSTKVPVLCFDCKYNENLEGKNITRVYSWYDVYSKIKEMCK